MNGFETSQMSAVLIQMSLIGFAFYFAIGLLKRILIPWHATGAS